jgi:4-azaleucine resistance transporter AzlC
MEKVNSIENATAGGKDRAITFTLVGALLGARRTIPVAIGVFAVGLVFGVLARQAHLTMLESFLMSGLVFAGASQFVALSLWVTVPLPVIAIILTTLVVNLRHLLMGASLRPWFSRLSPLKAYASVFFMVDESWAMSMSDFGAGGCDMAFLPGSGVILFVAWVSSTIIGHTLGSSIQDPAQWGLDFAFTAVFLALLTGMWKGKSDLLPWVVAAIGAVAAAHWLPGKWYILLGGLAGSITGALTHAK